MKIKISLVIVTFLICVAFSSIAGADVVLEGNVNVEVKEWLGVVYPSIEMENQSVTFGVEIKTEGGETTYHVNDTLIIALNTRNKSNRSFIIPRAVFYSVIIKRSLKDAKILPIRGFFKRVFPVLDLFNSVNVVGGMLGREDQNINVTLDYEITNTTFEKGENLTLTIFVMGFLPGDLNGLSKEVPIIAKKQIALQINYIEKV